jgi:hypothetical protein
MDNLTKLIENGGKLYEIHCHTDGNFDYDKGRMAEVIKVLFPVVYDLACTGNTKAQEAFSKANAIAGGEDEQF